MDYFGLPGVQNAICDTRRIKQIDHFLLPDTVLNATFIMLPEKCVIIISRATNAI